MIYEEACLNFVPTEWGYFADKPLSKASGLKKGKTAFIAALVDMVSDKVVNLLDEVVVLEYVKCLPKLPKFPKCNNDHRIKEQRTRPPARMSPSMRDRKRNPWAKMYRKK